MKIIVKKGKILVEDIYAKKQNVMNTVNNIINFAMGYSGGWEPQQMSISEEGHCKNLNESFVYIAYNANEYSIAQVKQLIKNS